MYLVGSLDRWNSAKQAEEKARVKHGVNGFKYNSAIGQYTEEEKAEREAAKLENSISVQV